MRHQPMAIAFVIAFAGATAIGLVSESHSVDWGPVIAGSMLAAAMTGLVASIMQFLPQRLFAPFTVLAGVVVGAVVSFLLHAAEGFWLRPIAGATFVVWAVAAVVALIVTRASGVRLPPVRPL